MPQLSSKRFVIVTGKGGVGKTTVCAALATAMADRGGRVLVAMCNAKERLSTMLGGPPVGSDVIALKPNLFAVNMDPEMAVEEYGAIMLKSRMLARTVFDNRYMRAFLSGVPGIHEWAMLGKAWWHTTETRADGEPKYTTVILDAPATGHGLDMLRVPKTILDVVPPGILRRDAELAWNLFQNPDLCAVVLVTIPEEMPTTETIELARALRDELKLPIGEVVMNAVLPPLFSIAERSALEKLAMASPSGPGEAALFAGRERAIRERVQAESLARLGRELPVKPAFLPVIFGDAAQPDAIRELAKRL